MDNYKILDDEISAQLWLDLSKAIQKKDMHALYGAIVKADNERKDLHFKYKRTGEEECLNKLPPNCS